MPTDKLLKCGDKHLPPTGRKCVRSFSPECEMSASPVSVTSTEASQSGAGDASPENQSVLLQQEILKQLQCVDDWLDTLELDMVRIKGAARKKSHIISSVSKSKMPVSELSMSDFESSSDDSLVPSLNVYRKSVQKN